jgi:agmatinase
MYLIQTVAESGKTIVGFDLNEVSPSPETDPSSAKASAGEWNQNVGMRVLWNLANWAAKSNSLKPLEF